MCCLAGCQLGAPEDPIIIPDVEKEFTLDLWENLGVDKRELVFLIQTVKNQNCQNYQIECYLEQKNKDWALSISKIVPPEVCQPGSSPAKNTVNAGQVYPSTIKFAVDLRETIVNQGMLNVTEESYKLSLFSQNGLQVSKTELLRIPSSAIWGYVAYQSNAKANADKFIQEINAISTPVSYKKGYYGHFSITDKGTTINGQPNDLPITTFVRQYVLDRSKLSELVERHRSANGENLKITLLTGFGDVF